MAKVLGTIVDAHKGFTCTIREDDAKRVYFTADADIDADGANGQNNKPVAYKKDNSGTEALGNGDMKIQNGKVVFKEGWGRDVVIVGSDNQPKIFPGGIIASMTWYVYPGKNLDDPTAYVNSEVVPYIVVPPLIIHKTQGVVRGCKARVTWQGSTVDCVVADKGPGNLVGELSIAAARALGIPNLSPRNGGIDDPELLYELWPGVAAPGFVLQPA